jgi:excinuclease ABC subunit A
LNDAIIIRNARTHNLKNLSCEIPHGRLTVISGVSGSGKSSLAFDTIYAEGSAATSSRSPPMPASF